MSSRLPHRNCRTWPPVSAKTNSLWLDWTTGPTPRIKSPNERMDMQKAESHELKRHPGARFLIWTATISDDRSALGNLSHMLLDLAGRHSNCARQLAARLTPLLLIAYVDECEALSAVHSSFNLCGGELSRFHSLLFC